MFIDAKYGVLDVDSQLFVDNFAEPAGARVLAVGDNEEYTGNILTDNGYKVVGIDLRPFTMPIPCNHERWQGNFNELADDIPSGSMDAVYSLSAIEHFGLSAYQEGWINHYADVIALDSFRRILKPGGVAYLTVPYGSSHLDFWPHWRVYSTSSLHNRLQQRMTVKFGLFFTSGPCVINGKFCDKGRVISPEDAVTYCGDPPHLTVFLKLRKPGRT